MAATKREAGGAKQAKGAQNKPEAPDRKARRRAVQPSPAKRARRNAGSVPARRPSGGRGKASATRPAKPPLQYTAPGLWSRAGGLALLGLAAYLAVQAFEPGPGWAPPLRFLVSAVGGGATLVLALAASLALLLIAKPSRLARPSALRRAAGISLLLAACIAVLGGLDAGGALGALLWDVVAQPIGAAALLLYAALALAGLVLAGLPSRLLWLGAARGARFLGRLVSRAAFGAVGGVVWLSRRGEGKPEPEAAPAKSRERSFVVERQPLVPPPLDEAPTAATQPMLPVIQRVSDEPPARRPTRQGDDWSLPPIEMLEASPYQEVNKDDSLRRAKTIQDTLKSFGVEAYVREIHPGPTVTQFAIEPGVGTKVSRITSLQNDLALALAAPSIRVEAPVPGQSRVGLEIPNGQAATVRLRDVFDSGAFHNSKGKLKLALGRDVTGRAVVGDLARMPHLLIAGATGAGKSVCLNSIIAGFLFQHTPDELRFLMVDPKMVELKTFDGVPHLVWPVVTEVEKVVGVLKYAVGEMERRYKEFSALGIRNLDGYNRRQEAERQPKLPRMIVIIDELADLMMAAPEEVEAAICRLAQMARAVGIHLILATQRPSVDVLTGLIKANFPSRIAFAVSSQIDSRVILDTPGAERLLGRGDMLFVGPDSSKPLRVQGAFVADEEIDSVVAHWKQLQPAEYDPEVGRLLEQESRRSENPHEDPLYAKALELTQTYERLSTSLLQRKLHIGYNRAARLMDALKDAGDLDTQLDA